MKQDSRLHTLDRTLDRVLAYRPDRRTTLAQAVAGAAAPLQFYEFFAGGGMARIGLGSGWSCRFANDIDESKASTYQRNFKDSDELVVDDIAKIAVADLPGRAHLAWASFPCQDLSLAGNGAGLKGERSGMFWEFWRLIQGLRAEHRSPRIIVLENVYGAITSHEGRDMAAICAALSGEGYRFAPLVIDQCVKAGVPFLFKQWGEWVDADNGPDDDSAYGGKPDCWAHIEGGHHSGEMGVDFFSTYPMYRVGKKAAGRLLDGRTWDEVPS